MDERFLIDTNILIYFIKGTIPMEARSKVSDIFRNSFNISTITKIETLGWHRINEFDKVKYADFLEAAKVFFIHKNIQDKTIELKQEGKIPIPDAIIAATALHNNFILVTRNTKDFDKIEGLKIYNPFE